MKLTDVQTILLSAASQRDDGSLYPLPVDIADTGTRLQKGIGALLKQGLAEERASSDSSLIHRSDGNLAFGLFLTEAGAAAIGIGEPRSPFVMTVSPVVAPPSKPLKTPTVIALLQRGAGATLPDLIAATGWLPHTTRAALTGLRKKGHAIERSKVDGVTTYRILGAA